jgi:hypothetical protein
MNVNYSEGSAKVLMHSAFDKGLNAMKIELEAEMADAAIYYALDGTGPGPSSMEYSGPFTIQGAATIRAVAFKDGQILEEPVIYNLIYHPAIGIKTDYLAQFSERYPAQGAHALHDGLQGSKAFNDGMWQGFNGNNLDIVFSDITLEEIHAVRATFLQDQARWIFLPEEVILFTSRDGINFEKRTFIRHNIPQDTKDPVVHTFELTLEEPLRTKYLRIQAVNVGKCPSWHEGAGQPCWIFADEMVIE